jgi:hypothetical protein
MTAEEIRALDGSALSTLAWELGLAPANLRAFLDGALRTGGRHDAFHRVWKPHEVLAQAEAVFRQLRTRGWMLCNSWRPARCRGRQGYLEAIKGLVHIGEHYTDATDEPLALLRVSVLAAGAEETP